MTRNEVSVFLRRRTRSDAIEPKDAATDAPPVVVARAVPPSLTDEAEEDVPRWRRPSLVAARKAPVSGDPKALAAKRLTFGRGTVTPDAGRELRRVRYRMVRLTDRPDELQGFELGRLDQDDEVELLQSRGAYWLVRTPHGQDGWVHRTTLGERVAPRSALDAV